MFSIQYYSRDIPKKSICSLFPVIHHLFCSNVRNTASLPIIFRGLQDTRPLASSALRTADSKSKWKNGVAVLTIEAVEDIGNDDVET